jgi:hypothetical protein
LLHVDPTELGQDSLGLFEDHAAVQRSPQLVGDVPGLGVRLARR